MNTIAANYVLLLCLIQAGVLIWMVTLEIRHRSLVQEVKDTVKNAETTISNEATKIRNDVTAEVNAIKAKLP